MTRILPLLLLIALSCSAFCESTPFADMHLYFNRDQKEIISAQEVVKRLKANNIVLATVSSTPSEMALKLWKVGGLWIQPFFNPYLTVAHRDRWFVDEKV